MELLLPVTYDDVGSRDYMSSELSDFRIMGVAIGNSMIRNLEDEIHDPAQCTPWKKVSNEKT